jgi:hypothetical protein
MKTVYDANLARGANRAIVAEETQQTKTVPLITRKVNNNQFIMSKNKVVSVGDISIVDDGNFGEISVPDVKYPVALKHVKSSAKIHVRNEDVDEAPDDNDFDYTSQPKGFTGSNYNKKWAQMKDADKRILWNYLNRIVCPTNKVEYVAEADEWAKNWGVYVSKAAKALKKLDNKVVATPLRKTKEDFSDDDDDTSTGYSSPDEVDNSEL